MITHEPGSDIQVLPIIDDYMSRGRDILYSVLAHSVGIDTAIATHGKAHRSYLCRWAVGYIMQAVSDYDVLHPCK